MSNGRFRLVIDLDDATAERAEAVANNIRRNCRTLLIPLRVSRAEVEPITDGPQEDALRRLTDMYNREHEERLHMARNPSCVCYSCERIRKEAING